MPETGSFARHNAATQPAPVGGPVGIEEAADSPVCAVRRKSFGVEAQPRVRPCRIGAAWVSASFAEASWQTYSSWAAAAMALAYDAARVTRDVDAMFKPHGIVHEEAMRVANDLGLPRWWLNEQASTYISGKEDADKRRVFDHPGLRVMAASPRHIFAMKARAARTRDIDDLRLLADIVGVESADAALQICANFYPDEPVSPRSAAVLRELFG